MIVLTKIFLYEPKEKQDAAKPCISSMTPSDFRLLFAVTASVLDMNPEIGMLSNVPSEN